MTTSVWRKLAVGLLGLALGALFFYWAAANVDFTEAKRAFRASDWRWILTGIIFYGASLLFRITRWRVILSYRENIHYVTLTRGLLVGYAINTLLPARLGELFRADYTARLANIPRSTIIASIFIERLFDLFMVVTMFGIGLTLAGIQNPTINRVIWIGVIALFIGMLLIYLAILRAARKNIRYFLSALTSRLLPESIASRIVQMSRGFADLMGIVRTKKFMLVPALTLPIWMLEGLSMFSVCRAVGLTLGPVPLMALLGGASLSTLFPAAPGFVGSYQFAFVVILGSFGISATLALVAATSMQLYLMGIYTVLGLLIWSCAPRFSSAFSLREFGRRNVAKS